MNEIEVDHLGLLTSRKHRRDAYRQLRHLVQTRPGLTRLAVLHEADRSCCATEPWVATATRLFSSLGERTLYAILGGEKERE
jgi:hypothetical protein